MCFSVGKGIIPGEYAPMVQVCACVRFFMRAMRDAECCRFGKAGSRTASTAMHVWRNGKERWPKSQGLLRVIFFLFGIRQIVLGRERRMRCGGWKSNNKETDLKNYFWVGFFYQSLFADFPTGSYSAAGASSASGAAASAPSSAAAASAAASAAAFAASAAFSARF